MEHPSGRFMLTVCTTDFDNDKSSCNVVWLMDPFCLCTYLCILASTVDVVPSLESDSDSGASLRYSSVCKSG